MELLDLSNLEGKRVIGTGTGLLTDERNQIKNFMDNYVRATQDLSTIIEPYKTLFMIRNFLAFE